MRWPEEDGRGGIGGVRERECEQQAALMTQQHETPHPGKIATSL